MKPYVSTLIRIATLVGLALVNPGIQAASDGSSSVADLAWIAGDWVGDSTDTWIQEIWTQPTSDTMIGMFRLIGDGQPRFYEFMSIELGDTGPVMRIKHFDPGLRGWEEKDESVIFELRESSTDRAVFESEVKGDPEFLTYERDGDALTVTLDKPASDSRSVFRLRRVGS